MDDNSTNSRHFAPHSSPQSSNKHHQLNMDGAPLLAWLQHKNNTLSQQQTPPPANRGEVVEVTQGDPTLLMQYLSATSPLGETPQIRFHDNKNNSRSTTAQNNAHRSMTNSSGKEELEGPSPTNWKGEVIGVREVPYEKALQMGLLMEPGSGRKVVRSQAKQLSRPGAGSNSPSPAKVLRFGGNGPEAEGVGVPDDRGNDGHHGGERNTQVDHRKFLPDTFDPSTYGQLHADPDDTSAAPKSSSMPLHMAPQGKGRENCDDQHHEQDATTSDQHQKQQVVEGQMENAVVSQPKMANNTSEVIRDPVDPLSAISSYGAGPLFSQRNDREHNQPARGYAPEATHKLFVESNRHDDGHGYNGRGEVENPEAAAFAKRRMLQPASELIPVRPPNGVSLLHYQRSGASAAGRSPSNSPNKPKTTSSPSPKQGVAEQQQQQQQQDHHRCHKPSPRFMPPHDVSEKFPRRKAPPPPPSTADVHLQREDDDREESGDGTTSKALDAAVSRRGRSGSNTIEGGRQEQQQQFPPQNLHMQHPPNLLNMNRTSATNRNGHGGGGGALKRSVGPDYRFRLSGDNDGKDAGIEYIFVDKAATDRALLSSLGKDGRGGLVEDDNKTDVRHGRREADDEEQQTDGSVRTSVGHHQEATAATSPATSNRQDGYQEEAKQGAGSTHKEKVITLNFSAAAMQAQSFQLFGNQSAATRTSTTTVLHQYDPICGNNDDKFPLEDVNLDRILPPPTSTVSDRPTSTVAAPWGTEIDDDPDDILKQWELAHK